MMGLLTKIGPYLLIIVFLTLCNLILPSKSVISDKRLCYDPHCEVVVSEAKTVTQYYSNDPDILSFEANDHVEVFSKSAGTRQDLWGVKIKGKRGYAPINLLHEKKVLQRVLQHEVDTELSTQNSNDKINIEDNDNSEVFPSYEVLDGTTVYHSVKEETTQNNNYATQQVPIDTTSSQETPELTVHPNKLSTSEAKFLSSLSAEIVDLEKDISTTVTSVLKDVEQSIINESYLEDEKSVVEAPKQLENVEQVQFESEEFQESQNVPENIPLELFKNEEIKNNKQDSAKIEEIIISENNEVNDESVEEKNNDIVDNKIEQPVIETTEPISEDMVTNALHRVSALFDSFKTTEKPQDDKTDDSIEDNQIPENFIEVDNITTTIPVQEIISDDVFQINTTEQLSQVDQLVDVVSQLNDNNITKVTENIVDDLSTNNGQPDIYKTDDLTGSSQDSVVKNELNINEFPGNRNLLNVGNLNQNEDVATATKSIETTTEAYTLVEETQQSVQFIPEPEKIPDKIVEIESPVIEVNSETIVTEVPVTEKPLSEVPVTEKPLSEVPVTEEFVTEMPYQETEKIIVNETIPLVLPVTTHETKSTIPPAEFEKIIDPLETKKIVSPDHFNEKHISSDTPIEEPQMAGNDDATEVNDTVKLNKNYWETFSYVGLTALTTLLFSLGYYYIENTRRDGQLIAKINNLEQKLIVATKECNDLDESLKSTTSKLDAIENESFGSNEMVASLKADLESVHQSKAELEDQVASLEKDLEVATEAGLELEGMVRELLASNNTENPLAKSVEDLQTRLNVQQTANESLTNSLQLKIQENETLANDLSLATQKCEQLEVEITRISEELKVEKETKQNIEEKLFLENSTLEKQLKAINTEKIAIKTQLKGKELELKDLLDIVKKSNTSNIDFTKLSDVSQIKAEASQLLEERDELKIRLSEVEGAHQLLEEHMKIINEEVVSLSEQCKLAEKEKRDAETKLEVLSKFFKEKEAERQKEEALWLHQQGEVSSTVERLQTLQNEIQSYRQQIETLKHEIVDQEREYKSQITNLEAKTHDQWVLARQNERRLEESKSESAQLRNRLTMMERNINDSDSDVKMHRMETNGETSSPLYMGADPSSSPIMFSGPGNVPLPPPPSYFMGQPPLPFMPPPPGMPPFDVGQRPPPLGGRLSSPPPLPHPSSGRYDNHGTPPPPLSPSSSEFIPPPPFLRNIHHSSMQFSNDRNQPPLLPPPLPPSHLQNPPWVDDLLPPLPPRNNSSGFHPFHRDQRNRDHRDSLHSSGESLDKSHRSSNV